jgi:hypothetical protein
LNNEIKSADIIKPSHLAKSKKPDTFSALADKEIAPIQEDMKEQSVEQSENYTSIEASETSQLQRKFVDRVRVENLSSSGSPDKSAGKDDRIKASISGLSSSVLPRAMDLESEDTESVVSDRQKKMWA